MAVVVRVNAAGQFSRIVNTVTIGIGAAGGIDIDAVIDSIAIAIRSTQASFNRIINAVVVAVGVEIVRGAVGIRIRGAFHRIRNAITIGIGIESIRGAVIIGVERVG